MEDQDWEIRAQLPDGRTMFHVDSRDEMSGWIAVYMDQGATITLNPVKETT